MESNIFKTGLKPTLEEVLENKERRVFYTDFLLKKHIKSTVITLKLNIPGEIKNNKEIEEIFLEGKSDFISLLTTYRVEFERSISLKTGPESFIVVDESPKDIKKIAVSFEESHGLGRLFDIDVLYLEQEEQKSISRTNMGYGERRCFLCEKSAKICSGRRLHSLEEMKREINAIVNNYNNT